MGCWQLLCRDFQKQCGLPSTQGSRYELDCDHSCLQSWKLWDYPIVLLFVPKPFMKPQVPALLGILPVHQIPAVSNCVIPLCSLGTCDTASWFGCHLKVPLLWAELKPKVYYGLEQRLCRCSVFRHAVRLCSAVHRSESVCWGCGERGGMVLLHHCWGPVWSQGGSRARSVVHAGLGPSCPGAL